MDRKRQHTNYIQKNYVGERKDKTLRDYLLKTMVYVKLSDNSLVFQCLALETEHAIVKVFIKIKLRHSHLGLFVTHHTIPKRHEKTTSYPSTPFTEVGF